jgi:hypothetical protein
MQLQSTPTTSIRNKWLFQDMNKARGRFGNIPIVLTAVRWVVLGDPSPGLIWQMIHRPRGNPSSHKQDPPVRTRETQLSNSLVTSQHPTKDSKTNSTYCECTFHLSLTIFCDLPAIVLDLDFPSLETLDTSDRYHYCQGTVASWSSTQHKRRQNSTCPQLGCIFWKQIVVQVIGIDGLRLDDSWNQDRMHRICELTQNRIA